MKSGKKWQKSTRERTKILRTRHFPCGKSLLKGSFGLCLWNKGYSTRPFFDFLEKFQKYCQNPSNFVHYSPRFESIFRLKNRLTQILRDFRYKQVLDHVDLSGTWSTWYIHAITNHNGIFGTDYDEKNSICIQIIVNCYHWSVLWSKRRKKQEISPQKCCGHSGPRGGH